jgi:integrase
MKLSVKNAASVALPAGKRDHLVFDDAIPGFGLRVREAGSRTWIYQYSLGDKQRRMVIGKASAIPADKARQIASELHAKVRLGNDPAHDKELSKAAASHTFGSIADQYLTWQRSRLRPKSLMEVERHIRKNAKPLHTMPLAAVDRRAIAARLGEIADASGEVQANRTRATLAAMYVWAMKAGHAESNPVSNTNRYDEQSRERVLAEHELALIWNACNDTQYGSLIKLLMLTGQRRSEIGALRWSEINFDKGVIELPPARTKNKKPHQVPMSETVAAILRAQTRFENRDLVFGYRDGPYQGWGEAKENLDARIAARTGKPLEPWTVHDLRRSTATHMADLGVQPHIIEAILNHVSGHKGGIAGIYNRANYAAEKTQALTLWAKHLAAIVKKGDRQRSN